jgi:hypothetical protein
MTTLRRAAEAAQPAEQYPAEPHQTYRFPVRYYAQTEDPRNEPVPEVQNRTAEPGKNDSNKNADFDAFDDSSLIHNRVILSGLYVVFDESAEAAAKVKNGVPFPRQQCVDADAGLRRQFPEGAPLKLVREEHVSLVRRKFRQCRLKFRKQQTARIVRVRAGRLCRKKLLQPERISMRFRRRRKALLPPKYVDDPVTRYAKKPRRRVRDGCCELRGDHELTEHVLHDIFNVLQITYAGPYKPVQPGLLPVHGFGNYAAVTALHASQ